MTCDFCAAVLPDRLLVCPSCARLVHGKRLATTAREAEDLEKRGELAAARDAWSQTLTLLPEDAMQASEIRARIAKLDGQAPKSPSSGGAQGNNMGRAAGIAGTAGVLLLGLKSKLGFVLAFAKSSKILLTGLTMLLSIWVYAVAMGLPFAALFVLLIWVHEMGHVILLAYYGVPASAPIFIPGMGALVRLKQQPHNVVEEAWTGLGGPLLGSVGAFVCLALGRFLPSELLFAVGHVSVWLNLFNLIPIHPLDGGRAAQILTPPLWGFTLAATVVLAFAIGEPLLVLAVFFPLGRVLAAAKARQRGGPEGEYHQASALQRVAVTGTYVGLVAILIASHMLFEPAAKAIRDKHKSRADLAWITSATE